MKEDSSDSGTVVYNVGYHFSRFRRRGWRGLRIQEASPYERAKSWRLAKLKGLYCMGILLMSVGFLICFNAIYRAPLIQKRGSVLAVSSANTEAVGVWRDSGSRPPKGLGD